MSRVVGFSLKLEGSQTTITELGKVETALTGISKQINDVKKINVGVLKPLFTGQDELRAAILATNKILKEQADLLKNVGSTKNADTGFVDDLKKQIEKLQAQIIKLKAELDSIKSPNVKVTNTESFDKIRKETKSVVDEVKKIAPAFDQLSKGAAADLINKITDVDLKLKLVKQNIAKSSSGVGNVEDLNELRTAEKALALEKVELNKQLNEQINNLNLASKAADPTSLIGLREELKRLKAEYLTLSEAERASSDGQQKFKKLVETNIKVTNIEQSFGDFRRNVGNYKDASNSLIPILTELQNKGQLANASLLKTFGQENKARVSALEAEVTSLANAFEKLTLEERQSEKGITALNNLKKSADELNTALKNTPEHVGGVKSSIIGLGDLVTGGLLTGGIIAAAGSLKAFGEESIQEFKQAEIAITKINAQLAATGNQAGRSAVQLKEFSNELEVKSGIDGDLILDQVTSKLLTFKRVQGEVFDEAQRTTLDLAAVMGGDLSSAVTLIGKALDNPIRGIKLLQKAGISLDADTKKQIETAIKANDIYTAQNLILKEVKDRVGGVSNAINNSDLKGLRQWSVDWNNFKEDFGRAVISILNGFRNLVTEFNNGTLFVPEGLKNTFGAINELNKATAFEVSSINTSFEAIKNENNSREVKKKVIESLVNKYPELIKSYQLEYASLSDLDRIQKNLTTTVKQQVADRTKERTKESIMAKIEAQNIREAAAISQDVSKLQLGDKQSIANSFNTEKAFENIAKAAKEQKKKLFDELNNFDNKFDYTKLGIDPNKVIASWEDAKSAVETTRRRIVDQLNDQNLNSKIRKTLIGLDKELSTFNIDENVDRQFREKVIKRSNEANKLIDSLGKKSIDATQLLGDETDKQLEKQVKLVDEQINRLKELRKKIEDLRIEGIDNEFDKQIESIKAKTEAEITDLNEKISKIQVKKLLTSNDQEELKLSTKLLVDLGTIEQKEIDKINSNRAKSIQDAKDELIKLQKEVSQILKETTQGGVNIKIDAASFNLEQENRTIKLKFEADTLGLKDQLAKGLITKKDFEEKSKNLELQSLNDQLKTSTKFKIATEGLYKSLYQSQLSLLKIKKEQSYFDNKAELEAKKRKNLEDLTSGNFGTGDASKILALKNLFEIQSKYNAKKLKSDNDYEKDKQELDQQLVNNVQTAADKELTIHNDLEDKKKDKSIKSAEEVEQKRAELQEQAIKSAFEVAHSVSDAIFEINSNQRQRNYDDLQSELERERGARLKLVKGNAAEEERINREFDEKKKKIDHENFERQKKASILQALINGALAITNIFATVPKFDFGVSTFILAGVAAATTAAQIAVIKSQSFADGGFSKKEFRKPGEGGMTGASTAPPDHTGKRPVGTATYHENEYTMPDWQVEKNKDLADAMEKDRRAKTNYHVNLLFKQKALQAVEAYENNPMKLGAIKKRDIPALYQFSYFMKESKENKISISEDSIIQMSKTIAKEVHDSISIGTKEGYLQSTEQIIKNRLRQDNLIIKRAI